MTETGSSKDALRFRGGEVKPGAGAVQMFCTKLQGFQK